MRSTGFAGVQRVNGIVGLFLCIVLMGTFILGAAACGVQGGLPNIVFTANQTKLNPGDFALYTYNVTGASKVELKEGNAILKSISGPAYGTYNGKVKGAKASTLQTAGSNGFLATLIAYGQGGKQETKTINMVFANPLSKATSTSTGQTGATDKKTGKSSYWGPPTSAPSSPSSTSSTKSYQLSSYPYHPEFFKCPSDCKSCLRPDEAAAQGLTQKCSEKPCYYSPNDAEKWYCYKPETGYCCKDNKVNPSSKDDCDKISGNWFQNETDANKACQQAVVYFCYKGKVYYGTPKEAAQAGVPSYSTEAEAIRACQQETCWCCAGGKVGQISPDLCSQMAGNCYTDQYTAIQACRSGYCCRNGQVTPSTPSQCEGGTYFTSLAQAQAACRPQPPVINSLTVYCPPTTTPPPTARAVAPPPAATVKCTLIWSVSSATPATVSISGIGSVSMSGQMQVNKGGTFTLTATSAGGSATRTVVAQ